ncbi:hypothetical protein X943_003015 [Babesia divergens]|uniref:Uncharacterized protein n=1 Tax=Babesia divergens TaxID=32595 RepID=A0AAD9LKL1_BABDI|nr:hypothetical protein X943_003015 [Babesia divergens]
MQNHSAFARDIHLALSSLITYIREMNALALVNRRCMSIRSSRGPTARSCKSNEYSPGKVVEQSYDIRKLKKTIYDKESIFPNLNGRESSHELYFTEPDDLDEVKSYYTVRDKRDQIPLPGFDLADPRSHFTNRDDATEEIDIDVNERNNLQHLDDDASVKVKLNKRCIVTKVTTTVELPVNKLTGKDALNVLLYNIPQYSKFKMVESLYKYIQINDSISSASISLDPTVLHHLKNKYICWLGRRCSKQGKLDALALALQSQLYAFRPYDIAAAVSVFGKYGSRYNALLNTLGLVFYDLMIAGKTAVTAEGPSKEEIMAVLKSYAKAQFPVKRIIDAGFGSLYKHIDSLTVQQMISILDDFFALSKDANFVELITHIMAKIFRQPALFVDKFQLWAEEQLNTDFQAPSETQITMQEVTDDYTPTDVLAIMRALSVCNSEYIIQSVHYRIAFKRLWSDNISKRNMPWQGPVVEPPDSVDGYKEGLPMIESTDMGSAVLCQNSNEQTTVTVGHPENGSNHTENGAAAMDHMDKKGCVRKNAVITYRDQLPSLYGSILRIMLDTLHFVPHPERYLKLIYESNCRILEMATSKHEFAKEIRQGLESLCTPCYPFKASLYSYAKKYQIEDPAPGSQTRVLPFFKKGCDFAGESKDITEEYVQLFHAQNLVRSMLGTLRDDKQTTECDEHKDMAHLYTAALTNLTEEAVHCISLGACKQVDGNVELVRCSANDLSNAIAAICDYSRYANECHSNTVALLGALYFRILFVNVSMPSNGLESGKTAIFGRFFETAAPRSLMVDFPYLPFTENPDMMGETEFHQTGNAEYKYYRPSPIYVDLVRGKSALYGIMVYALAHKIQYALMQEVADDESLLQYVTIVTTALEHVLHPFYLVTRATNPMLRWQMLYYNGTLNKCHELSSMAATLKGDEHPTHAITYGEGQANGCVVGLEQRESHVEANGENGIDTDLYDLKDLSNTMNGILEEAVESVATGIAQVVRCPNFRHAATVFVNVCITYMRKVIDKVSEDSKLLSIRGYSELSTALSMLIAFEQLIDDGKSKHRLDALTSLKERLNATMISEIVEIGKIENTGAANVSALPIETSETADDIHKGRAEFIDELSQQLDAETFMHTARSLVLASTGADDTGEFVDALHSMMLVMYNRLTYMSNRDILRSILILCDLNATMKYREKCHAEDPRDRLAQVALILREQALELIAKPSVHTEDGEHLSAVGRCVLQHWLV